MSGLQPRRQIIGGPFPLARKTPDLNFLTLLKGPVVTESEVKRFPGESLDHVFPGPRGTEGFRYFESMHRMSLGVERKHGFPFRQMKRLSRSTFLLTPNGARR